MATRQPLVDTFGCDVSVILHTTHRICWVAQHQLDPLAAQVLGQVIDEVGSTAVRPRHRGHINHQELDTRHCRLRRIAGSNTN